MSVPEDKMKCRYCDFTVFKWRKTKEGKTISGWRKMEAHLEREHDIEVNLTYDIFKD